MTRALFVVRTANRPEILNRCLTAAVEGCDVAQDAFWLVLDDSAVENRPATQEVVKRWNARGLRVSYVDRAVEERVAEFLPEPTPRTFFARVTGPSPSAPTEGRRNFGLIAGLSLKPDVLFFVDDDMVHRHEENCFFHWCANNSHPGSFIAAPLRLGIVDMAYLDRLVRLLDRDDWHQFVSEACISSDLASWYSPKNPFWEQADVGRGRAPTISEKDVVSGGFIALRNNGEGWLPFPGGFNSDINWSILQSTCLGTAILWVSGFSAQHLPPGLGHPGAESILSEIVGTAITRALLKIEPGGRSPMNVLAIHLPDLLRIELKQGLLLFMDVERAVLSRIRTGDEGIQANRLLFKIRDTLADVASLLKSVDSRQLATDWLDDFATRKEMFLELCDDEMVQLQFRRMVFDNRE